MSSAEGSTALDTTDPVDAPVTSVVTSPEPSPDLLYPVGVHSHPYPQPNSKHTLTLTGYHGFYGPDHECSCGDYKGQTINEYRYHLLDVMLHHLGIEHEDDWSHLTMDALYAMKRSVDSPVVSPTSEPDPT